MSATQEFSCEWCEANFFARMADRARGWGRFCSKACKASKQKFGGTKAFWEKHSPGNKRSNIAKYGERLMRSDEDDDGELDHCHHPFSAGFEGHGQN